MPMHFTRRKFNRLAVMTGFGYLGGLLDEAGDPGSTVAIVKTSDRERGIPRAVALLKETSFSGKHVYLKCNYNSADSFPATTHPETLRATVKLLKSKGSQSISLVERSGMGLSREVLQALDTMKLIRELSIQFIPLEDLTPDHWQHIDLPGSHWKNGVEVPNFITPKACIVQVCNLKTHRFGGQFSASLKNSIGLIAKYSPGDPQKNYMKELHDSPFQSQMIAEANKVYSPQLIIMDAVQTFVSGGPESGELANSGIIAASVDRVALDAIGLALLRHFGAGFPLNRGAVFDQAQIKRAADLGLGVRSARQISVVTDDEPSRVFAARMANLLDFSFSK
jgi:uncharacterized protein (DUF362 family)